MCKKILRKHEMEISEILTLMIGDFPHEAPIKEFIAYCDKRRELVDDAIEMNVRAKYVTETDCINLSGDFCEVIETETSLPKHDWCSFKDRSKARYNAHGKRKEREEKLVRKSYKAKSPKVYKRSKGIPSYEFYEPEILPTFHEEKARLDSLMENLSEALRELQSAELAYYTLLAETEALREELGV